MPPFVESFLWIEFANNFFIYYVAAREPNLSRFWGDNLTHPMLINPFYQFFDLRVIRSIVKRLGP